MRVLIVLALLAFTAVADEFDSARLRIEKIQVGIPHDGQNSFSATAINKTNEPLTLVLDLRTLSSVWPSGLERQFPFIVWPGAPRQIEAPYEYRRVSAESSLRVRLYFPEVAASGVTRFGQPFFDRSYPAVESNPNVGSVFARFRKLETRHFLIYYHAGSLAEKDLGQIAVQRDSGFEKVAEVLGVRSQDKIRLFFFPDAESKYSETGHQGAGWAFTHPITHISNIVEVHNDSTRLNPYHETAHILASTIGQPAAVLNEGFATYVSELLGSDALADLGSPGMTCANAVLAHRGAGHFVPLEKLLTFDDIGPEESQPAISYPEACSLVGYLIRRYGPDRFRQAYASVAPGGAEQLQKVYGASVAELERAWLANLVELVNQVPRLRPAPPGTETGRPRVNR